MSVKQRQSDGTLRDIAGFGNYALDSELNPLSINGVQNRTITAEMAKKATQYSSLPTASADYLGLVVQYIGSESGFSTGGFYQCQEDSGTYAWVLLSQAITVDSELDSTSDNPVQNKILKDALDDKVDTSSVGSVNGIAQLDSTGKVPISQLPATMSRLEKYANRAAFPAMGDDNTLYVALDTNYTYRWTGADYVQIDESIQLGETSSTAYRGDRGKTAYDHSQTRSGNPHNVTKSDVGLGNVGNFKAVSTVASQGLTSTEQANARANIGAGTGSVTGVKGNSESSYRSGNVNLTAANVGLGNVGNFKAVSTVASQGLSSAEQTNARNNIGAAASSAITNMQEQYYQTSEPSPSKVGAVWIG